MTPTQKAAMRQALEALEDAQRYHYALRHAEADSLIAALRAALAEPEQEPVAWLTPRTLDSYMRPDLGYETCSKTDYAAFPVYTAPPQRKPLSEREVGAIMEELNAYGTRLYEFARAIEKAHGIS